jgi:ABC-type sulfate/molybdate transport systems ATPase subunit
VVTSNQLALGLEVHAIRHDLENAGQLASAVIAVERRVIKVDRYDELHWRPNQVSGASLPLVESHTGTVSAAVHTIHKSSRTDFNYSTQTSRASHSSGESALSV